MLSVVCGALHIAEGKIMESFQTFRATLERCVQCVWATLWNSLEYVNAVVVLWMDAWEVAAILLSLSIVEAKSCQQIV
jgi:hypothetical protein